MNNGFWSTLTMKRAEVTVNTLWTWDLLCCASLFTLEINAGEVGLHKGTLLVSSGAENLVDSRE